ncbi:MAG TPA: MaoC family dehydratase [Myxococcaceae bacterium]|nr:MaoC family dehydratase [Myxococcaceae bacterium]
MSGTGRGEQIALEDLAPGQRRSFGPRVLTREEIIAFARDWDPQPFHLDEEAAARSPFGGLIASGWQTAALCMRLVVDGLLAGSTSMGSPGLDELRWLKPVRPGDAITVELTILEVTPSRSKPDRGTARISYVCTNQKGETVMTMIARSMFLRRGAAAR